MHPPLYGSSTYSPDLKSFKRSVSVHG
jgi:hypothetical protein